MSFAINKSLKFELQKHIETHYAPLLLIFRRIRYGHPFRKIPLTRNKFAIVDPEDYDRVSKYKWHIQKGPRTFYAVHSLTNGKTAPRKNLRMHRLILEHSLSISTQNSTLKTHNCHRHIGDALVCDHINHNGLDNRKANLRPATHTQNTWHRRKFNRPSRSKYKGVDYLTKPKSWRARIRVNGKRIYLGAFKSEIEAAHAYDKAAKKHHGHFATLNFK